MEEETETSEFGKGFAYCLGLFLAHERDKNRWLRAERESGYSDGASMWFNAAADHLFDLQIPDKFSADEQKDITEFQNACLKYRHDWDFEKSEKIGVTWEHVNQAVQKAKSLLLRWDEICQVPCIEATWA